MRPILKPGLRAFVRDSQTVQIGLDPRRAVLVTGSPEATTDLLTALDGTRDTAGVLTWASTQGIPLDDVVAVLAQLRASGLLANALAEHPLAERDRATRERLEPDAGAVGLLEDDPHALPASAPRARRGRGCRAAGSGHRPPARGQRRRSGRGRRCRNRVTHGRLPRRTPLRVDRSVPRGRGARRARCVGCQRRAAAAGPRVAEKIRAQRGPAGRHRRAHDGSGASTAPSSRAPAGWPAPSHRRRARDHRGGWPAGRPGQDRLRRLRRTASGRPRPRVVSSRPKPSGSRRGRRDPAGDHDRNARGGGCHRPPRRAGRLSGRRRHRRGVAPVRRNHASTMAAASGVRMSLGRPGRSAGEPSARGFGRPDQRNVGVTNTMTA